MTIQSADEPELPLDLPDLYVIPDGLVKKWLALPADQIVGAALPRIAWDQLYQAIDLMNLANLASISVASATRSGDESKLIEAVNKLGKFAIGSQNALKHFQSFIMIAALGESQEDIDLVEKSS